MGATKVGEEVQAETILHPTPFVIVGGSNASVASSAEASSTPLDPAQFQSV